jgi:hypothetical protein
VPPSVGPVALRVRLEIAAPSEMKPTKSAGPVVRAMYEEPSERATVILASTYSKPTLVPKMFPPTDNTPGEKVKVAATPGKFVENSPDEM